MSTPTRYPTRPASIQEAIDRHYTTLTEVFMDFDHVVRSTNRDEYELILRFSDVLFLLREIECDRQEKDLYDV